MIGHIIGAILVLSIPGFIAWVGIEDSLWYWRWRTRRALKKRARMLPEARTVRR